MPDQSLPSFRNPPVVETVLGIQFAPLTGFFNGHLGAFWNHLRSADPSGEWNRLADAPVIPQVFERFGDEASWEKGLAFRVTQEVASRLQVRNSNGSAMIQFQNGRLHYNWIGHTGENQAPGDLAYPRFSHVRPRFERIFEYLEQFLRNEGLSAANPNQWEVTYVNHIPQGSVWTNSSDWQEVFPGLPGIRSDTSSVRLETFAGAWHFEIPERRGRLHIDLKHARLRSQGAQEVLRLTLTARGPVEAKTGVCRWKDGLDLGHQVVVKTFREITSCDAHKYWELES